MNFGEAIEALKDGKVVQRTSFPTKDTFVFMQVKSQIPKEVVPKMQSLPQSVKDFFQKKFDNEGYSAISYRDQLAIVGSHLSIKGWSPSVEDTLAEDWRIVE